MPTTIHIRTAYNATNGDDPEPQTLTYVTAAAAADALAAAGLTMPLPEVTVPGVEEFSWGRDCAERVTVVDLLEGDRDEFDAEMWKRADLSGLAGLIAAARTTERQVMELAAEFGASARRAGWSVNAVSKATGVNRGTVDGWWSPGG